MCFTDVPLRGTKVPKPGCIQPAMRNGFRTVGLAAQSLLYVAGGVNHFWHSRMYTDIMPPHYDHPLGWVRFTGLAEIAGGLGLLPPQTRRLAAWGLFAMLLVYLDVHFYMATYAQRFAPVPRWALWLRVPVQLPLLYWAWVYTHPAFTKGLSKPSPVTHIASSSVD